MGDGWKQVEVEVQTFWSCDYTNEKNVPFQGLPRQSSKESKEAKKEIEDVNQRIKYESLFEPRSSSYRFHIRIFPFLTSTIILLQ